ncbi:MAG: hypothetical protein WCB04_03615 [Mycobacteriales bacterium]
MTPLAAVLSAAPDQPAQAGPLGLFVILALGVVTVFLIRSMGRHLKRVPPSFDPPAGPPAQAEPPDDEPGPTS